MKKKFSKNWNKSKRPGKKRKYLANVPVHERKDLVRINLSKDLRKKYDTRNVPVRKGDTVEIMRGKFKKKKGKVTKVFLDIAKVTVEKIQAKKQDGSKADVKLQPSNLRIVDLDLEDRKRKVGNRKKTSTKKNSKKEEKKKSEESKVKEKPKKVKKKPKEKK